METKEDGRLDWNLPAVQLWRRVRAYYPWPGCFTDWKGVRLKIIKAVPLSEIGVGKVGEVVALPHTAEARVAVQTTDGLLGLIDGAAGGKEGDVRDRFHCRSPGFYRQYFDLIHAAK